MIEDLLRESFHRHEGLAPPPEPVRGRIEAAARLRRRRGYAVRGSVAVLALAALVAVGAAVLPDGVRRTVPLPPAGTGAPSAPGRPITLLLLGLDSAPGGREPTRADTIMLAHLPAVGGPAYLISIPRQAGPDTLSNDYARRGAAGVAEAVRGLTGMAVDGAVEVEFSGLVKVTDAVGGVDLCVERRMVSDHSGRVYEPGCRHFTGAQAMDYLRQRKSVPDGDLGRARHNREYLRALATRLAGADLKRLYAVLAAAGDGLRIDVKGFTLAQVAAGGLAATGVVAFGAPADLDGELTPDAASLWDALRRDDLGAWVTAHPDRVDR